jgi:hypothetical protein
MLRRIFTLLIAIHIADRAQLQYDDTCREDSFHVWVEQTCPYSLKADMRGRQFSSMLIVGFCSGVTHSFIHLFIYLHSMGPHMAGRPVDIEIVKDSRTNPINYINKN